MRCPRCDRELAFEDRFCGRCGLSNQKDGRRVDPLIGITIAGRYTIEKRIGVGGMGTVYLGTHTRLGQQVAVKVLHERYAEDEKIIRRFEKEALTYGQVSHPNLVGLHDYGRTPDGTFFMVLEYCPGLPLSKLLEQEGSLPTRLAVDIVIQVAQGLGAAHEMGIVHRDLKPENIILTSIRPGKYHARLLDFGIAKRIDEEGPRLTQAGMVFGTPEYMAPEQARGKRVDARSDLYSLGTLFYELLTGSPPFYGPDKLQVMHRQAHEEPIPVKSQVPQGKVSDALETVVEKAMAKDPDARFADTHQFIESIERATGDFTERATVPASIPQELAQSPSTKTPTDHMIDGTTTEQRQAPRSFSFHDAPHISARPPAPPTNLMWAALVFCGAIAGSALLFAETQLEQAPLANDIELEEKASVGKPSNPSSEMAIKTSSEKPEAHRRTVMVPSHPTTPNKHPPQSSPKQSARSVQSSASNTPPSPVEAKTVSIEEKARAKAAKAAKAKAEAARLAAVKAKAKKRKKQLSESRNAIRKGKLERAAKVASQVLKSHPGDREAKKLKSKAKRLRKAVSSGKKAFAGADCVKALALLEPVLADAPGVQVASRMVSDCRKSLPPRQL